jgi:methanogenic corrinoid protein MtbC1
MVDADRAAASRIGAVVPLRSAGSDFRRHVDACLAAIADLDAPALDRALEAASVELGPTLLVQQLMMPLMREVGDRWKQGSLRIAHEHMATALVRSFLGTLQNGKHLPEAAPRLLAATPLGQVHELGALMVCVAATTDGWRATYLGVDLPADEIAGAAAQLDARAVALSMVYPADDPRLVRELRELAAQLDPGVALIVGGASAPGYAATLEEIGARSLDDVTALGRELAALRQAPPD